MIRLILVLVAALAVSPIPKPAPMPVPDPSRPVVTVCHGSEWHWLEPVNTFSRGYYLWWETRSEEDPPIIVEVGQTLQLPRPEARQHLQHGDTLGSCPLLYLTYCEVFPQNCTGCFSCPG